MNNDVIEALKRYQKGYPAPARLDYYLMAAQARKDTATDDEALTIRALGTNVDNALQAISEGDFDRFAQAFEYVIRRTVELNLPAYDKVMERANQSKRANVRAKNYAQLKLRAIELYENGNWNSPRAASFSLEEDLGAKQRTIHKWLLKHVNNKT